MLASPESLDMLFGGPHSQRLCKEVKSNKQHKYIKYIVKIVKSLFLKIKFFQGFNILVSSHICSCAVCLLECLSQGSGSGQQVTEPVWAVVGIAVATGIPDTVDSPFFSEGGITDQSSSNIKEGPQDKVKTTGNKNILGFSNSFSFFFFMFFKKFYLFIFYTAGSYQLSILYILVYTCQSQSPNSSPPAM